MRILILGGGGMLGHKLVQYSAARHETWTTLRQPASPQIASLLPEARTIAGIDAADPSTVRRALDRVRPNVVVDCIGIVKQRAAANDPATAIGINALFPHLLSRMCAEAGARLVHISTDCVFSGERGRYKETDSVDGRDLYGQTKALGEVSAPHALTLRTSMIGRELSGHYGLVDWFLSQRGSSIRGYRKAIFSGFTTLALSAIIVHVIERHPTLSGLYHVSADPISKYDLLHLLNDAFRTKTTIIPDDGVTIDRSLDSTRFRNDTGFCPAPWPEMIDAMAADPTPYDNWSTTHVS